MNPTAFVYLIYHIAGIFRWAKFSRSPLWLYYSNYSRVEFSCNGSLPKPKTDLVMAGGLLAKVLEQRHIPV